MQRGSRITKDGGALKSFLLGVSSSTPAQPFLYPIDMVLTPMQEAAHAAIRQRESVLLLSPTGSGKTLAYLLPLIERVEEKIDDVASRCGRTRARTRYAGRTRAS